MGNRQIDEFRRRFAEHGQEHVFRFWDQLDESHRSELSTQAARIDLPWLARAHAATGELLKPSARALEPAPVVELPEHGGDVAARTRAETRGEQLISAGRVAALVVAGGQGTRLGFDAPKGTYPIGPASDRSLFELQAQKIRGTRRRHDCAMPWYVMTSPATDAATRRFFEEKDHFGLPAEDVFFFCQSTVPALDFDGRLMLESPGRIVESPDGHGGSLTGLVDSGALADMERRGVTTISYYQVDNPLVRIADAVYLGLHAEAEAEISCKVVRKQEPGEKVGVVAQVDGALGIVEYTEIDLAHRTARDERGELVYWAGSTAIHLLEVDFVRRIARDAERYLPFHASAKKIPTLDENGQATQPSQPNGHKLERFVFDALPAARRASIVEARRQDEYSPVKNADGADSPESARGALVQQYRGWLEAAEIRVPADAHWIEIDHSVIDGAEDARRSGIRDAAQAGSCIRIENGASS